DAAGTQHLERLDHHHAAAQRGQRQRCRGVEPARDLQLGGGLIAYRHTLLHDGKPAPLSRRGPVAQRLGFPGRLRLPEATLNTSATQSSGACTLALTRRPAVTPSKPPAVTTAMSSNGTCTSTVPASRVGLQPGLSSSNGNPGQVLGRRGFAPSGMSTTANASLPQAGFGCSTTQWLCQRSPSLSRRPSPFSSNKGVSSKSGCAVTANARMPALRSKPTSHGSMLVGHT